MWLIGSVALKNLKNVNFFYFNFCVGVWMDIGELKIYFEKLKEDLDKINSKIDYIQMQLEKNEKEAIKLRSYIELVSLEVKRIKEEDIKCIKDSIKELEDRQDEIVSKNISELSVRYGLIFTLLLTLCVLIIDIIFKVF